jgi:hypothetical protein
MLRVKLRSHGLIERRHKARPARQCCIVARAALSARLLLFAPSCQRQPV